MKNVPEPWRDLCREDVSGTPQGKNFGKYTKYNVKRGHPAPTGGLGEEVFWAPGAGFEVV